MTPGLRNVVGEQGPGGLTDVLHNGFRVQGFVPIPAMNGRITIVPCMLVLLSGAILIRRMRVWQTCKTNIPPHTAPLPRGRSVAALHPPAVVVKNSAVAFLDGKHAGKSSRVASFMGAGHAMLSDDLLMIEFARHGEVQLSDC